MRSRRNTIVSCSADIIVALPGSFGTNSEICYGLVYGRPVIDLGNWNIEGMIDVKNVADAEEKIKKIIQRNCRMLKKCLQAYDFKAETGCECLNFLKLKPLSAIY